MTAAAARRLDVRLETVDSNGLLPLRAADRIFQRALDFRRFLQKNLPAHLPLAPRPDPLDAALPPAAPIEDDVLRRWPRAPAEALAASPDFLASLPIDHAVPPAPVEGGWSAAARRLQEFLARKLDGYGERRNDPDQDASSGLSPYLHFGHVSPHQVFHDLARLEGWRPDRLARAVQGKREGWWGMSPAAEAFLDQLVVWRELGYNMASKSDRYDRFDSLPQWAQATLEKHAADAREHVYSLEQFESAATHDPLWNAAQNQLRREGRIHNYLRMLWGKKILQWSPSPRQALEVMIHLNNKYAVDGRNPNSYTGIFWILGRYDRPWGPERPVFGVVRYMSSENTARKFDVRGYMRAYADDD
jgi:deoxyribodipyrimidine photo-lyase